MLVGTVTGVAGLHKESIGNSNCSDATRTCTQIGHDANQSAKSLATVSAVGFAVGILGAGISTYLWLTLPDEKAGAVGVGANDGTAVVVWRSRW
jgi:hypothetical protein